MPLPAVSKACLPSEGRIRLRSAHPKNIPGESATPQRETYTDLERDLQRPTTSPGRSSQHVVPGRWLFSFAVSAPRPLPPADVGRAISARGREGSFCTFSTSKVVTMLRAYASRVGVFLRDFLSFFSRVAARSRALLFLACTTCVSGRLVAKDFSCGGGAVRLSATRSPRSSRAFWRVYVCSRRKSPPSTSE